MRNRRTPGQVSFQLPGITNSGSENFREATPQELRRIENQKETNSSVTSWRAGESNIASLTQAFRNRTNTVILSGERYTISYRENRAYVKAERGYSPAGWFDIAEYLRDHR